MYYNLQDNWTLYNEENLPSSHFVAVMTQEEAQQDSNIKRILPTISMLCKETPFTKAEIFSDFIYGTITVPQILNQEKVQFAFIVEKDCLYLISNSNVFIDQLAQLLELRKSHMQDTGLSLYYILEHLVEGDLEKINLIQDQLSCLEEQIFRMMEHNYSKRLTEFRSKTLQLSHYYLQLTSLITMINENCNDFFNDKQLKLFELFTSRITLLKEESAQLWAYTSQVREIYQEQLDVRQNKIMKILTIVTTIFFPLSLITGWYGMNFEYMPELHYRYSYLVVIVISIIIVVLSCIWFKKKRFW